MTLTYEKMKPDERKACAHLAAEAFYDYEYFSIYISNEKRRKRCLDAMIQCEFRANWNNDKVVFMTARERGSIVAVAQMCAPGYEKPSDMDYILSSWLGVMLKGGIQAVNAWNDMEKQASAPCHSYAGKSWYLSLYTVAKADEGKGIGSQFLRECLIPYAKEAGGETLTLFTNSEMNRRFYEKNGFSVFDEKQFTYAGKSIGNWSFAMQL